MKNRLHIFLFFFVLETLFFKCFSQDINLSITSKNDNERKVLETIIYKKKHTDSASVKLEIQKLDKKIKTLGYFTYKIINIKKDKSNYNLTYLLGVKIKKAILKSNNIRITRDSIIEVDIKKLESKLNEFKIQLDLEGKSLSKVKLDNINVIKNILYANLSIQESKNRKINKTIIKGYNKFPRSFLKNYFNINENIFSEKKIKEITRDSKNLSFVDEIKSPELLFTKDSSFLYLYFKKKQNNSIDAIISFSSKENGDLLFNGNIDLNLENILNTGERFNLLWNSIGEERQEFKISSYLPFLFNSKFSSEIDFSIYKQDSTFTNTKINTSLEYILTPNLRLFATYNNETSDELLNSDEDNFSFKNNFYGLKLKYLLLNDDVFRNNKLLIIINPEFGKRKSDELNSKQFKIKTTASYLWELNSRNQFYLKNESGLINSDQFFNNELFRIGGANSIRGFNEQSIFTNKFTYFNLEYRFLTSSKSLFYTITDIGFYQNKINNFNDKIIGLGLGYKFLTRNSLVNISFSIGKTNNSKFDFRKTTLNLNLLTFFK